MIGLLGKPSAWPQVQLWHLGLPHVKLVLPKAHLTEELTGAVHFFWYSQMRFADSKEETKGEPILTAHLPQTCIWGNLFLSSEEGDWVWVGMQKEISSAPLTGICLFACG